MEKPEIIIVTPANIPVPVLEKYQVKIVSPDQVTVFHNQPEPIGIINYPELPKIIHPYTEAKKSRQKFTNFTPKKKRRK